MPMRQSSSTPSKSVNIYPPGGRSTQRESISKIMVEQNGYTGKGYEVQGVLRFVGLEECCATVSSTIRYPPATVNKRRKAKSRSMCPDQVPWSIRVKRSWETLSNASAMAEQVVMLVKYSKAMRYIHTGSGIESHLPSESLCLFLCGLPVARIYCYKFMASRKIIGSFVRPWALIKPGIREWQRGKMRSCRPHPLELGNISLSNRAVAGSRTRQPSAPCGERNRNGLRPWPCSRSWGCWCRR